MVVLLCDCQKMCIVGDKHNRGDQTPILKWLVIFVCKPKIHNLMQRLIYIKKYWYQMVKKNGNKYKYNTSLKKSYGLNR